MKTCPNCGATLPGGGKICLQCGADVAGVPLEAPASPAPGAEGSAPLFTPTFAAESGDPGLSAPGGGLPTGKEAEDLLARALADTGPSLVPKAEPQPTASAPARFEGVQVPLSQPSETVSFPSQPPAEDVPADLFAQPAGEPADLFAQPGEDGEPGVADSLLGGDTAEFDMAADNIAAEDTLANGVAAGEALLEEEAARQVFPTRQFQASGQTLPYESQQNIQNLFEESGQPDQQPQQYTQQQPQQYAQQPQQRYPQQEGQPRQRYNDETRQAGPDARRGDENNRAAMVANIAQAAGADEDDRQRPRPMAGDRDVPRPQPPTRRAPARPSRPVMEEDWPPPRKRRSTGKLVRNILLIVLLFLVATFLATVGLLYYRSRPAAAIESFAQAVTDRDYRALGEMVSLNDAPSTEAGWEAFCDAFAETEQLDALKVQLGAKPSSEDDVSGLTYQAVTLESDTLFLFVNKYYVRVTGIEFLAPGAAEGTGLEILGGAHSGTPTAEGVLYGKFMPGLYTCRVTPPGGEAGPELSVEAFDVAAPNRIEENADAPAATATVTLENCLSDDAVLYVNNNEVSEKPQGGTAQLENVPVGAEIKIVASENGAKSQSTVFFSDANVTTLRFENYTPVEGEDDEATAIAKAATPEQINQTLATFYTSYLECINAQSMAPIQLSTKKNNAALAQRISSTANAANTYSYRSAACKADSIVAGEEGGTPSLKFNGTFEFSYAPRDDAGNVQNGSNRQSVHLLYVGGQWVVDGFVFLEEGDYNNNVIANF